MRPPVPRFAVVNQETYDCPYLPDRIARTPLRLPSGRLDPAEFDDLLAQGDRRSGPLLYRTECPSCRACEAVRVPAGMFQPSRSQRRVLRRNEGDLRLEVGAPQATPDRIALYNRHRLERGLARDPNPVGADEYRFQYVTTCTDTIEVDYLLGDRLVAVSLLDLGRRSASSVYHYFDPDESRRSLGVYSVLAEIEMCARWGFHWYYLGLWTAGCASLSYKSSYYPHERLQNGAWNGYGRAP